MAMTKAQMNFVNSKEAFIRLLAPAGCGKTFSIVEKAKKLFSDNPKVKISIFTFTRNAAEEIRTRCDNDTCVTVHTLNSWGNNYIKANVLRNPRIVSGKDTKWYVLNTLQPIWTKAAYSDKYEPLLTKRARVHNSEKILELIDEFKNIGFKHTDFSRNFSKNMEIYNEHLQFIKKVSLYRYYSAIMRQVLLLIGKKELDKPDERKHEYIVRHWIPFWCDCCEQMLGTGQYTFDDQKYFANVDLAQKIRKKQKRTGAAKIDYIFIDEFQDTSPLDLQLISNLQQITGASLIIVGDDDQAIYEFRGASPYFILHPEKIFGAKFKTFVLDENFRSPANIVEKSMKLIKNNQNRVDKNVVAKSSVAQAEIQLKEYDGAENMVDAIIQDIKVTLANNSDETVAVLSRKKSALLPYQILLTKENISYSVSDDLAFFYTSAAANLNRAMDIKRKSKLGPGDLTDLVCMFSKNEFYKEARETLYRALNANYATIDNIDKILLFLGEKQPRFEKVFLHDYVVDFHVALDKFMKTENVYDTLAVLLGCFGGFQQNYNRSLEDLYYKDPPLASLLSFAAKYDKDFDGFVDDFNRAIDRAACSADNDNILIEEKPRIILSTALRVKGQEFGKVIILDCIDGIWPCFPSNTSTVPPEEVEAERRLFYVATTRAKKYLHLYRNVNIAEDMQTQISPFVIEGDFNK